MAECFVILCVGKYGASFSVTISYIHYALVEATPSWVLFFVHIPQCQYWSQMYCKWMEKWYTKMNLISYRFQQTMKFRLRHWITCTTHLKIFYSILFNCKISVCLELMPMLNATNTHSESSHQKINSSHSAIRTIKQWQYLSHILPAQYLHLNND